MNRTEITAESCESINFHFLYSSSLGYAAVRTQSLHANDVMFCAAVVSMAVIFAPIVASQYTWFYPETSAPMKCNQYGCFGVRASPREMTVQTKCFNDYRNQEQSSTDAFKGSLCYYNAPYDVPGLGWVYMTNALSVSNNQLRTYTGYGEIGDYLKILPPKLAPATPGFTRPITGAICLEDPSPLMNSLVHNNHYVSALLDAIISPSFVAYALAHGEPEYVTQQSGLRVLSRFGRSDVQQCLESLLDYVCMATLPATGAFHPTVCQNIVNACHPDIFLPTEIAISGPDLYPFASNGSTTFPTISNRASCSDPAYNTNVGMRLSFEYAPVDWSRATSPPPPPSPSDDGASLAPMHTKSAALAMLLF